jgi:hypothetical protein
MRKCPCRWCGTQSKWWPLAAVLGVVIPVMVIGGGRQPITSDAAFACALSAFVWWGAAGAVSRIRFRHEDRQQPH